MSVAVARLSTECCQGKQAAYIPASHLLPLQLTTALWLPTFSFIYKIEIINKYLTYTV